MLFETDGATTISMMTLRIMPFNILKPSITIKKPLSIIDTRQ